MSGMMTDVVVSLERAGGYQHMYKLCGFFTVDTYERGGRN